MTVKRKPKPKDIGDKIATVGAALVALPPSVKPHATVNLDTRPDGWRVLAVTVGIGTHTLIKGAFKWKGAPP